MPALHSHSCLPAVQYLITVSALVINLSPPQIESVLTRALNELSLSRSSANVTSSALTRLKGALTTRTFFSLRMPLPVVELVVDS